MPRVGADIQAILTVLGRRELKYDKGVLNLENTDLRGANLNGARLGGAILFEADLRRVGLRRANLDGAHLGVTHLTQTQIDSAHGNKQAELPYDMKYPESWPK